MLIWAYFALEGIHLALENVAVAEFRVVEQI
jgi:hypothetical protein